MRPEEVVGFTGSIHRGFSSLHYPIPDTAELGHVLIVNDDDFEKPLKAHATAIDNHICIEPIKNRFYKSGKELRRERRKQERKNKTRR